MLNLNQLYKRNLLEIVVLPIQLFDAILIDKGIRHNNSATASHHFTVGEMKVIFVDKVPLFHLYFTYFSQVLGKCPSLYASQLKGFTLIMLNRVLKNVQNAKF